MAEPSTDTVSAPIVAVTVYRDSARITRRGRATLTSGDRTVFVEPLPLGLQADSIRVSGRGPATVLGVDVTRRHQARTTDPAAAELERERRELRARRAELDDLYAVESQRAEFLQQLATRAGGTFARAVASGDTNAAGVAAFGDGLAEQLAAVHTRQRDITHRREELDDQLAAVDRKLVELGNARQPDRLAAAVGLAVDTDGEVEIELSYVVGGAGWQSAYDLRLDESGRLTGTWYGLVGQHTGEDWPECDLRLSTARPAGAVRVPELDPWFIERVRPIVIQPVGRARMQSMVTSTAVPAPAAPGAMADYAGAEEAAPVRQAVSTVEQGVAAATYRPTRPVAVPADGSAHRATVAVFELDAVLDYVTAPVLAEEAHLRATVTNSSPHTLLPGSAAVFHGADFVGKAALETWAPGEEVELALGIDDRVRVEREMVRRTASKVTLGTTRRREAEYRISIANHTPRAARVTVLDQVPVSRDEKINVRELRADPAPVERTELGVLTWQLDIPANESRDVHLGYRVEVVKDIELAGWRE